MAICYTPPQGCSDCDIEWCPDPDTSAPIPETRGGGIFLFADTVICANSNTDVIFGGRTKISLDRTDDDTLFFSRQYIYSSNIFGQYYFNASGTDLTTALNSDAWFIPFDLSLSARPASDFSCLSNSSNPCSSDCKEEAQSNGCYRCKCSGTSGDCDYKNTMANNPAPYGILVVADNVSEQH